jgi:soluble lytic murein transglycosylase
MRIVSRCLLVPFVVAIAIVTALPAGAETFRFTAPDGTIHFTNVPPDPRSQQTALPSGASPGEPSVPGGATAPYLSEIREAAVRYGVPERVVSAVIRVESGFNPRAISPKGARGLMQLMPGMASILGVRNSFDPRENIEGGVRHLRGLMDRFSNNLSLALAAYNAGEQAVTRHRGIPPFPETQGYVSRILSLLGGAEVEASTSASAPLPPPPLDHMYRMVASDGAMVYTNIPPRARR